MTTGRNASTGPVPDRPSSERAPAPGEHGGDGAERRDHRQQVERRGDQRDQQAAEHRGEQHERQDDDDGDEQRELAAEDVREVDRGGGLAADVHDEAAAVLGLRDQAVAQRADERDGPLVLRRGGRVEGGEHRVLVGGDLRGRDAGDPRRARRGREQPAERGLVAGAADLARQLERAVEPGAEAVGEGGVGLVGGPAGRVGAGVGGAQPQPRDGQRDQRDRREGGQRGQQAVPFHQAGPA